MQDFMISTAGEKGMTLHRAICLYAEGDPAKNPAACFATVHEVANNGTPEEPCMEIMPGRPITQEALLALVLKMAQKYSVNTELLPANVLSVSASHLVWWVPAKRRRVFFKNEELGQRSAEVPHPPLLFSVVKGSWSVCALKEDVRPTEGTELYFAPYFNTYDNCSICVGSAAIPRSLSTKTIAEWENAFFDSAFTHMNGKKKKIAHKRGEYAFWKEMLDGVYAEFPLDLLVPLKLTLDAVMKDITMTFEES